MKRNKKQKFYENKLVNCMACGCEYWRNFSPPHHVIRRTQLKSLGKEISDPKYFIDLCRDCHYMYHFSPHYSGLRFYLHAEILDKVIEHVDSNETFLNWIEFMAEKNNIRIK